MDVVFTISIFVLLISIMVLHWFGSLLKDNNENLFLSLLMYIIAGLNCSVLILVILMEIVK